MELVKHTTAQLTATRDQLWAARGDLANLGVRVMLAGLDPSTNSVVVGVEGLSPSSASVIGERFPSMVTVRDEAQTELDLHGVCESRFHCWPHKGGIEMNIPWNGDTYHCTSGFMVKRTNLTPNRLYILTAGHCIELTGGVSVNRVWTHVGADLGYSAGETWATNAVGDAGVIFVLGNPTVDREFLAREGPIEIRALASVAALVETKKGTYICRMGRTTGRQCGFIFLVDVTRDVDGRNILHQYEVDFDSNIGDSGAPMFEGTKGYGIATDSVAGYVPANHAWFSPLYWERQALMGVNINIEYCLTNTCP